MPHMPTAVGPRWGGVTSPHLIPAPPLGMPQSDEGCARLGEWLFVPPPQDDPDGRAVAYLERGGEQVRLEYSSWLVADFARSIRQIESDFTRRFGVRTTRTGV